VNYLGPLMGGTFGYNAMDGDLPLSWAWMSFSLSRCVLRAREICRQFIELLEARRRHRRLKYGGTEPPADALKPAVTDLHTVLRSGRSIFQRPLARSKQLLSAGSSSCRRQYR
jgi:hypothetical protein